MEMDYDSGLAGTTNRATPAHGFTLFFMLNSRVVWSGKQEAERGNRHFWIEIFRRKNFPKHGTFFP
jgi:hypothetical protein